MEGKICVLLDFHQPREGKEPPKSLEEAPRYKEPTTIIRNGQVI
jgi:hypothetical protein